MKNLNIVILYKNNSYKIIPAKKINNTLLNNKNIRLILIPLYENPNSYIPIKPSYLYEFKKAIVSIAYQAAIYEIDDEIVTSFDINHFYKECDNLIDFINAIYNAYKFRGVSIYLAENTDLSTGMVTFTMSIRQINIKLFDDKNQLIEEIDSGIMKDLSEYNVKYFRKTPIAYTNEDRLNCLKDILYLPDSKIPNYDSEIDTLPICIHLQDNMYSKVKKPNKELQSDDYILYRIPDFEIYYMMQYGVYNQLLNFKSFEIHYISSPISVKYDDDYLTSLDNGKIPSYSEKAEAIEAYLTGDLFSISNTHSYVDSIDKFLQSLIFSNTILNYIKYFGIYCYAGEGPDIKVRTFILFGRVLGINGCNDFKGDILLTDLEANYENILKSFIEMIMKGK